MKLAEQIPSDFPNILSANEKEHRSFIPLPGNLPKK
jgi:hypothetical protein